jgi:hypothetical protein
MRLATLGDVLRSNGNRHTFDLSNIKTRPEYPAYLLPFMVVFYFQLRQNCDKHKKGLLVNFASL